MDAQSVKERNLLAFETPGGDIVAKKHSGEFAKIVSDAATVRDCLANGYAPVGHNVLDFTITKKDGLYHLFHIPCVPGMRHILPGHDHWLGHAVSKDLDTWTTLDASVFIDPANDYESAHVWAPFVCEAQGTYYMHYTGVTPEVTQVICMAAAQDGDLLRWKKSESNPVIPIEGFDWHWKNTRGRVADARDPHIVKTDDCYLLAYTALHKEGCPAVGGMVSDDILHWEDIGPILYRPIGPNARWSPESVNIQPLPDGKWALFPSATPGITYYVSDTPYAWHRSRPTQLEYEGHDNKDMGGIELLARDDANMRWLVAYFGKKIVRLFIGVLDFSRDPWTVRRVTSPSELEEWPILRSRLYCSQTFHRYIAPALPFPMLLHLLQSVRMQRQLIGEGTSWTR